MPERETLGLFIEAHKSMVGKLPQALDSENADAVIVGYQELFHAITQPIDHNNGNAEAVKARFNVIDEQGLMSFINGVQEAFLQYAQDDFEMVNGSPDRAMGFAWVRWQNESGLPALNPMSSLYLIKRYGLLNGEPQTDEINLSHEFGLNGIGASRQSKEYISDVQWIHQHALPMLANQLAAM